MAYITKYQIKFTNYLNQEIVVSLQKKDGIDGDIIMYAATACKISYQADEGKYTSIIGLSAEVSFDMRKDDPDYWPDFENSAIDDWKMIIEKDSQIEFLGFVVPDEGSRPFQDRPFDSKITAVDGLGLIKDISHRQSDQTPHVGDNYVIWHIASALLQTGLVLPIRIYDNVFHSSMNTPDNDPKWCMFNQTKLEARTFKKNATEFVSSWEALNIILKGNYRLFQWNGRWVIVRIGLIQYYPFAKYYVEVDYNGANPVGYEYLENYATVGKNELVYPINEDQIQSNKQASKSVRTTFNYNIWPDIPLNNKFDYGELVDSGDEFANSVKIGTYKRFTIRDWVYGRTPNTNNFEGIITTENHAYRRSSFDLFGIEKSRQLELEKGDGDVQHFLRSEILPVRANDKISVSVDHRRSISGGGTFAGFYVILRRANGSFSWLDNRGNWRGSGLGAVEYTYQVGEDISQWRNYSVESIPLPFDGTLYVMFTNNTASASTSYYQNFNFDYMPYVAGGYQQVKGDYWITSQEKNFPDKIEEEVFVSDARHKVVKGCLLDLNGIPYTPDWKRHGVSESRHFKEISNLEQYNHAYRRFWFIEGSFKGIVFAPSNDQENYQPLGLHKQYRFVDIPGEDRRFMITSPLEVDLITSEIKANFHEVFRDGSITEYKKETIQQLISRIRHLIDTTNAPNWALGGSAPAEGTPGFPPATSDWIGLGSPSVNARRFMVIMNPGAEMTMFATGTTTIERITAVMGGFSVMGFTITNYEIDDVITVQAYGRSLNITVEGIPFVINPDGQQKGDSSQFKYVFE